MNSLQAIVLAGGYGTRLAPLTKATPKPLLDILGKSVLERVIDNVLSAGITDITVTAMYKYELIQQHILKHYGSKIRVVRESTPLGTAGAVKNAYNGTSQNILVLSGDGIFDFDLKQTLQNHISSNADVTIATVTCQNPTQYGILLTDEKNKIRKFIEKPAWYEVCSKHVNTGIYVLNREVLDYVPQSTAYDFSKQLFPSLMSQSKTLCSHPQSGYWCDIGSLDDYFKCICDGADGKIKGISYDRYTKDELLELGVDFTDDVCISKSAKIGKNVKISSHSFIGKDCTVSDGCTVELSIISDGCTISEGTGIYGSILSKNVRVGINCVIPEHCVLSDNVNVRDGVILSRYSRLNPNTQITKENHMLTNFASQKTTLIFDNGIFGIKQANAQSCTGLGIALGNAVSKLYASDSYTPKFGILSDFSAKTSLYASCIKNGAVQSGLKCYDYEKGHMYLADYICDTSFCDCIAYVYTGDEGCYVKLFDKHTPSSIIKIQDITEKEYFSSDTQISRKALYEPKIITGLQEQYIDMLQSTAHSILGENLLHGFEYKIKSDSAKFNISPSNLLIRIFDELGAKYCTNSNCPHSFHLSPDGTNVYYENTSVKLDHNHICALLLKNLNSCTENLPDNVPEIFNIIANIKAVSTPDTEGVPTHSKAHCKRWLEDGIFAAVCFSSLLHTSKKSASELLQTIPGFEIYIDEFAGEKNRASVMEKLYKLDSTSSSSNVYGGVKLKLANGTVTVIPGRISGFKIISEAQSSEAAKELCGKIEDIIAKESKQP